MPALLDYFEQYASVCASMLQGVGCPCSELWMWFCSLENDKFLLKTLTVFYFVLTLCADDEDDVETPFAK